MTHATDVSEIIVNDWRDSSNQWKINVSASPMKVVNGTHELPEGTLNLNEISSIHRWAGNGSQPLNRHTTKRPLDNGKINLVEAYSSKGEFRINFPKDALEITVDPTTTIIDNPSGTKYETTITWELVTGP